MEARKCVGNRERAQTSAIEFGEKTKKRRKKSCEKARKGAKMQFSFNLHANALFSNRLEFTGMKYNDELIVFCMIGS